MNKRVLFVLTSADHIGPARRETGSYLPEVTHPYAELVRRGYTVDFASIEGGEPPVYGLDAKDEATVTFREGDGWAALQRSRRLRDVDASAYAMVFVPGGLGPMVDMVDDADLHRALVSVYERGGVVGAVCHGSVALMKARLSDGTSLVAGRRITSFSNAEEDTYAAKDVPFLLETALREHGAIYSAAAPWQAHVVADGRVITGQNPASATGVAHAMVDALERADEPARRIAV